MSAVAEAFHGLAVNDSSAENHPAEVLHDGACLHCILSFLDDDKSLLRASAVCKQWKAVVDSDTIWEVVYRRILPQPLDFEHASRYLTQRSS